MLQINKSITVTGVSSMDVEENVLKSKNRLLI